MTPAHFLAVGKALGVWGVMTSPWGWAIAESAHFLSLAVLVGTVGLFDLRMLGVAKQIPLSVLHRFVPFGAAAFGANVVTGSMFFLTFPDQYLYNLAFQLKLCVIALAGANMVLFYVVIGREVRAGRQDADPSPLLKLFGGISLAAWLTVITLGRVITLFRPPYISCPWC